MSIRRPITAIVLVCVASLLTASIGLSAESSDKPADAKASKQAKPPDADKSGKPENEKQENIGAVQRALIALYQIPRSATRQFGRDAAKSNDTGKTSTPSATDNRLGLQHIDAIRKSQSSTHIGDDIKGAIPEGNKPGEQTAGGAGQLDRPPPYYYDDGQYAPGPRLSSKKRDWADYRYFGGQPSRYGYGRYTRRYGLNDDVAGQYYRFGFTEGYDRGRFEAKADARTESLLKNSGTHMQRGLQYFREGQYRDAATAFRLAAELDQGDPAARIYAAHALFTTGRFSDAVQHLRRAFDLQPAIALLTYDMRDDYSKRADFDKQVEALENALKFSPRNMDRLLLLAYVHTYSNQRDKAYELLAKAKKTDPGDHLVDQLMQGNEPPDVLQEQPKAD